MYGEPRVENRHLMWTKLRRLKTTSNLPWLVIGDFNEVMWDFEHFSSSPRPQRQMQAFRDSLENCELADLGFSGVPRTYDNKRSGNGNVKVRLDRAVASPSWRNLFEQPSVRHLISPVSDHVTLHVSCDRFVDMHVKKKFRQYEVMWKREPAPQELIARAWADA